MAMSSLSSVPLRSISTSSHLPYKTRRHLKVTQITSKPKNVVVCNFDPQKNQNQEGKKLRKLVSTALAAVAVITLNSNVPSMAEVNKYEAETRGGFGMGSVAQYGSADFGEVVHVNENSREISRTMIIANGFLLPVDPWAPNIDSQSIASQLFAFSLFPYIGFLYFITKSKSAPKLTLFGFYFLLAFVGATIPAGIYAKLQYGTSLSNVDYLHGGAESLLTLTNLFIVLGLRAGIRRANDKKEAASNLEISETDKS